MTCMRVNKEWYLFWKIILVQGENFKIDNILLKGE